MELKKIKIEDIKPYPNNPRKNDIAAEQNGRTAYLMEIDPHYCDVILTRWENLTGERAEKL